MTTSHETLHATKVWVVGRTVYVALNDGREVGFPEAFHRMPRPTSGKGCAISPYQESDLIFSLDPRAIVSAFRKSRPPRAPLDSSNRLW